MSASQADADNGISQNIPAEKRRPSLRGQEHRSKRDYLENDERRKKGIIRGYAGALQSVSILQSSANKKRFDFSNIAKTAKHTIDEEHIYGIKQ